MFCRLSLSLLEVRSVKSQCGHALKLNQSLTTGGRDFVLFLSKENDPDNSNNKN